MYIHVHTCVHVHAYIVFVCTYVCRYIYVCTHMCTLTHILFCCMYKQNNTAGHTLDDQPIHSVWYKRDVESSELVLSDARVQFFFTRHIWPCFDTFRTSSSTHNGWAARRQTRQPSIPLSKKIGLISREKRQKHITKSHTNKSKCFNKNMKTCVSTYPIPHILVLQDKSRPMDMSLSEQSDSHTCKWREAESGCQHPVSAELRHIIMWTTPALCWLRPHRKPAYMFAIQTACEHENLWKCGGHVLPCQNHLLSIVVVLDSQDRCDNQFWSSWWPLQLMTPWCGNKCWSGEPVCGCCQHQPKQLCWNTLSLESVEKSEEPHRAAETHCRETRWHWQPQPATTAAGPTGCFGALPLPLCHADIRPETSVSRSISCVSHYVETCVVMMDYTFNGARGLGVQGCL